MLFPHKPFSFVQWPPSAAPILSDNEHGMRQERRQLNSSEVEQSKMSVELIFSLQTIDYSEMK